jgi:hypothetical protein
VSFEKSSLLLPWAPPSLTQPLSRDGHLIITASSSYVLLPSSSQPPTVAHSCSEILQFLHAKTERFL